MQTTGLESLESLADARYELAIHGRYGDTTIGHLTPGEMVLPRPIADDPVLKRQLFDAFERHELNPHQYQVGHFENSINPLTGAPEFGWFKKLGKSIKKAAPTIGQVVGFAIGGPAGAAIGGGIGGGVKEGNLKGAVKGAAQGYVMGNVAAGFGVKGGTFGSTTIKEGLGSLNPFNADGMFRSLNPAVSSIQSGTQGTIGGFFQDIGASGAGMLRGASAGLPGAGTSMEYLGLADSYGKLSGLGKVGAGLTGLTALGGLEGVENNSQMPGPSGAQGGYLQNPLRPAVLPTQYGTQGVGAGTPNYMTSGIGSSAMLDPATAAYLRSTMEEDEYSKLMFPEFNEGGVMDMRAVGGDIEDPNGSGDVDTVNAILADGEFVMTKQAVTGLGEGDHEAGIARLYAMMDKNENKAQGMGIGRA
tara:strand:+ start:865 stop:2115 length:1251 start_codon:yes stop_codon:yes gene_type:complete